MPEIYRRQGKWRGVQESGSQGYEGSSGYTPKSPRMYLSAVLERADSVPGSNTVEKQQAMTTTMKGSG